MAAPHPWDDLSGWWTNAFTEGADPEYEEQILPLIASLAEGAKRVLDIGCGEGQIARMLADRGATVIGIDPSGAQLLSAQHRGIGPHYLQSGAARLPVATGGFDLAVACLVFEHIDELDSAIAEVARALEPGGRFVFLLNHPLIQTPDSALIVDHLVDPPEIYWRIGPYLEECSFEDQVNRGVFVRFVHRPLSRYLNVLADNGLVLERMYEPPPPAGYRARQGELEDAANIPRLLGLLLRKR